MTHNIVKEGKRLIVCTAVIVSMGAQAWAGSISGVFFILRPWLAKSVFSATADQPIRLHVQLENEYATPVVIKGLKLKWEVLGLTSTYARSGTVDMNAMGAPPLTEFRLWPHGSTIRPIADFITPPVQLVLPVGRYSYVLSVVDAATSNGAIVLASNVVFEVK